MEQHARKFNCRCALQPCPPHPSGIRPWLACRRMGHGDSSNRATTRVAPTPCRSVGATLVVALLRRPADELEGIALPHQMRAVEMSADDQCRGVGEALTQ